MYKYQKPIFIAIIVFFTINAYANKPLVQFKKHWYLSAELGTQFSANGNTKIPSIASKPPLTSEPVYNSSFMPGLNFGYEFSNSFRLEAELAYQYIPMDKINNAIGSNTVTNVKNSSTELLSLFANGFYDFNMFQHWVPYIGAGIGYVDVNNTINPDPVIPVAPGLFFSSKKLNYDTLGYQGIVGISYQLTHHLNLALSYKYFSTLPDEAVGSTNLGPDSYKTNQKISDNTIVLGFSYFFI